MQRHCVSGPEEKLGVFLVALFQDKGLSQEAGCEWAVGGSCESGRISSLDFISLTSGGRGGVMCWPRPQQDGSGHA